MQISRTYLTSVQLVEPFVWCYADGDSILYAALVLMLMLSALPRMDTPASYLIFRSTRRSWLIGQIITTLIVTFGYCLMILLSSMLIVHRLQCVRHESLERDRDHALFCARRI